MKTICTVFSLLLLLSCFACHKDNLCNSEQDVTQGDIEQLLELDCFVGGVNNQVIRSTEQLQGLFTGLPCEGEVPDIDFNQYTLLGQFGGASGCERFYDRSVQIKDNQQQYIFSVKVSECGGCEPFEMRWHWVLVPILPEDYTVSFEFETR